ncbi:MAG: SDR family NAD(P)-dependent oxidoreductase [Halobacteriales archaeon]|nr:SDR family NAD(P)-dependent oxidoreductase [Halobacteriales archaeon]
MHGKTAVIAGVGPGLGESLATRFAEEGYSVGLFARSADYLSELEESIEADGGDALAVPTDITSQEEVSAGFEEVRDEFGGVDVLVNHASAASWKGLRDSSLGGFENAWRVAAYGGFLCSKHAVEDMVGDDKGGTIIFTGATSAVRGRGGAVGFSSAKFAVRGLAESMARELGPEGVHVAHVVIDGMIDTQRVRERFPEADEDGLLNPDEIADSYVHLVEQDRSAWTLELDLRPHVEEF